MRHSTPIAIAQMAFLLILGGLCTSSCSEAVYPPRPPAVPGPPVADPPPSRVVMHITLSRAGLTQLLDAAVPQNGGGGFNLLGERRYGWRRGPFELRFDAGQGRIGVRSELQGEADIPGTTVRFSMALMIEAQPVLSADYKAVLQSPVVTVTTEDRVLRAAEWGGGVLQTLRTAVEKEIREARVDLRPMLDKTYKQLALPLPFAMGDAKACANLGLRAVEAGPTILADGVEKDLAVLVEPSVVLPCPAPQPGAAGPSLPPLQNVGAVPSGYFELTVPVAATYAELQRAMSQAFTGGKLFFSKEYPEMYMEKPEVWAADGQIVLKVHIDGYVKKGFRLHLEGDLYLHGHPQVRDNVLEVPDLKPTIETTNALLKLKGKLDSEGIEKEARQALRLDISQRLESVKARLSSELTYKQPQLMARGPSGCVRADLGRVEVSGVHAHESYLRVYVKAQGRAAAYVPCPF